MTAAARPTVPADGSSRRVELDLEGMTCASCAARIERKLNKVDGATATVNYALEQASVTCAPGLDPAVLVAAVESAGYGARVHAPPTGPATVGASDHDDPRAGHHDTRHDDAGHHAPHASHGGEHDHGSVDELRTRTLIAAVLSAPVVAMAMVPRLQFDHWQWLSLTLASPVVVWAALPFHRATWRSLRHGATGMDTLVSLGTISAYAWSLWALFLGDAGDPGMRMRFDLTPARGSGTHEIYLEVASAVTAFLLAGRWAEARAKRRSGAALRALLDLGAKDVALLRDGREERVPVERLVVGDRFVVRPGEQVATDGVVEEGTSAVDASLLTGESVPAEVGPGDAVAGATVNASGRLVVRATRVGADTHLARIARLVTEAQTGKAAVQRLADRVAAVFVPVVLVLAAATLGFWLGTGEGAAHAFTAAVAVLIIACPCALGLATPTALLVGTGRGAQLGILIKGPEVLESTRRIDTVVLDKTGTVTTARMTVVEVVVEGEQAGGAGTDPSEADALHLLGAVEDASEHPVARAIADAARERPGDLPPVTGFRNHPGLGVEGTVEGRTVLVGRPALLERAGIEIPAALVAARRRAEAAGRAAVVAAWTAAAAATNPTATLRGNTPPGRVSAQSSTAEAGTALANGASGSGGVAVVVVADAVKPTSAAAIAALHHQGLRTVLLTGDQRAVAEAVAAEVGIDEVEAEVLPADKVDVVRRLQAEGRVVAMVGDGVNDAAALAAADLGLAMGTGTDAAIEASDLTLVRGDLRSVPDAIALSRRTLATIRGNLFWAFAYNVAALPLAAAGYLNPMIAGAAMALSSVFVVTNSLRLRRFTPTEGP